MLLACLSGLALVAGQIARLALAPRPDNRLSVAEPVVRSFARPDLVDRQGRLVATDVGLPSLFADPSLVIDVDETVERLGAALPGLDEAEVRRLLSDRTRRFAWIRRGLTPLDAQRVHDEGLPGLAFRREPKRIYPNGALVGHLLGHVDVDNRGRAGLERHIDEALGLEPVSGPAPSRQGPVVLSLDLGVQQGVAAELALALGRYRAKAAAGLVMNVATGEIVAAVSLPSVDPNRPAMALEAGRADRLHGGVYELGSIFKALTVAMAAEAGTGLDAAFDTRTPIEVGRHRIRDHHPAARPLSVRDIFLTSSNVGAGRLALAAGAGRQRAFLARLGLTEAMRTEAGPVAPPLLPERWGEIETVTIAYGHGLAVAPVQFAAAAAALVNGGLRVEATFLARASPDHPALHPGALAAHAQPRSVSGASAAHAQPRVLPAAVSEAQREIWRLNVTAPNGTGRRAEVAGMRVGGKTGTAEIPGAGGYREKAVIASFVGAFPMDAPRWLTLISLFEPQGTGETTGQITAGWNAAPTTARIVARIAPVLGVLPRRVTVERAEQAGPAQRAAE